MSRLTRSRPVLVALPAAVALAAVTVSIVAERAAVVALSGLTAAFLVACALLLVRFNLKLRAALGDTGARDRALAKLTSSVNDLAAEVKAARQEVDHLRTDERARVSETVFQDGRAEIVTQLATNGERFDGAVERLSALV